jgi:hypothetical protein
MAFFCGRIRKKRTAQDGGAKNLQGRGIVIVQENGMIIESAGAEDELTYHNRSDDPDLLNKLKRAGVSVKTYKKLEALIRRMNWDAFYHDRSVRPPRHDEPQRETDHCQPVRLRSGGVYRGNVPRHERTAEQNVPAHVRTGEPPIRARAG